MFVPGTHLIYRSRRPRPHHGSRAWRKDHPGPCWHTTITPLILERPLGADTLRHCSRCCTDVLRKKEYILDLELHHDGSRDPGQGQHLDSRPIPECDLLDFPIYRLSAQHAASRARGGKAEGDRRLRDGTLGL